MTLIYYLGVGMWRVEEKVGLFITKFYKRKEVRLKDLDLKFIQDLEYFFKIELKLKQARVFLI
ncbi:hypothetical protein BTO04_14715 [Polaribacter sp. SA4-10]|nr:hypothetical protein BTO04_14715 [Polaribacter sp. SA4-10]